MSTAKKDRSFNSELSDRKYAMPEIWGGLECTINRIGDRQHDQLDMGGHYALQTDFSALADLGITSLRFPILWEKHQPDLNSPIDWTWAARQLSAIRRKGIKPIAGLLHHGSGPLFTDLMAPDFPDRFAAYAGQVAARFPWLEWYTPVNEPLTTARFSGLYGIWYPHRSDPLSFMKMLLNQVRGTVKAMKAIRRINPHAKLIQTEDLAKVHSTPRLIYQAEFENHRRWLTFDLLCGKVDQNHPLWSYLEFIGINATELSFFTDNPCPPDILGLNYYITSERFLDESLALHPRHTHGGNGRHVYADIEAIRVIRPAGLEALLRESWERYGLPIAITEAHLHCTREEQARWLNEIWDKACRIAGTGIDIRAVTSWALCGTFDWDSLLTRFDGHYESGACQLIDGDCYMTAIGYSIRSMALTGDCNHPLLSIPGWWHRDHNIRFKHGAYLLIICDDAQLRSPGYKLTAIMKTCETRGLPFVLSTPESTLSGYDPLRWSTLIFYETILDHQSCNELLDGLVDRSFASRTYATIEDPIPVPCL